MSTPTVRILESKDPIAVGLEGTPVAVEHDRTPGSYLVWHQVEVEGRGRFWASKIERLLTPVIVPNHYRYAKPSRDRF